MDSGYMKKQIKKILSPVLSKRYGLPGAWKYRPPDGIRLVDVRSLDELAEHAGAWNELFRQADRLSPMLSYPWMSAFFQNLVAPPERWLCLFAYENERIIGIFPLVASYSYRFMKYSLQLFKLPYHFAHTSGTDCLTLPGREDIFGVFLDYLNCIPSVFPCFSFKHIPEHYASIKYFAREDHKMCVVRKPAGFEDFIPVPESAEKYFSGLSANFRKNLNKASRKLEELKDISFRFCENTRSAQENTARFLDAENRCWKGRRETSIKNYPDSARMFEMAAEGLSGQGMMAFSFLETGDKTIAAQYAMRVNRTLHIPKMGYDEDYASYSPGNMLLLKVIEAACGSGAFDELNLVSDPEGISKWNVRKRPLYHLIVFPEIPILSRLLTLIIQSGKVHNFNIPR
jgi:hypothetical protein